MKEYSPNYSHGKHTVEITLQSWEYKGKIIRKIGGNCKGFSILETATEIYEYDKYKSDCELKIEDDWFSCVLKNEAGDTLEMDDELDNLGRYITKVEIVNFEEE